MLKVADDDLNALRILLDVGDLVTYLRGHGTETGRISCKEAAASSTPKPGTVSTFDPTTKSFAPEPFPGYEFVYDWYIERIGTGSIFRANGRSEATINEQFPDRRDLLVQRIDISKRQVLLAPRSHLGNHIDTHA